MCDEANDGLPEPEKTGGRRSGQKNRRKENHVDDMTLVDGRRNLTFFLSSRDISDQVTIQKAMMI
jgi:hypothetical protein